MSITLRERELKSGKKSLYLDIYENGNRRTDFLKLYLTGNKKEDKQTLKLAENIRAKRQLEIAHRGHGFTAPFKRKANFIEYFEKDADSFDSSTKKQYHNVLKKLKSYDGDNVPFGAIDRHWIEGFKDFLLNELGNNTARTYFAMFKASLNRAVKLELIPENPADKVDGISKSNGRRIQYLTVDELRTLASAECPNPEVKLAFLFSCYTGLRYSDIEKLTWEEIEGSRIVFQQKKTNNVEYLPLSSQALSILKDRPKKTSRVFDLPTNAMANRDLKKWADNAELKKWIRIVDEKTKEVLQQGLVYHVSRHTFAVQILAHGGDIYTLKELMGHSSIQSTEVYAKVVNKKKEDTVNILPEVDF